MSGNTKNKDQDAVKIETKPEPEAKTETKPEPEAKTEAKPKTEAKSQDKTDTQSSAKSGMCTVTADGDLRVTVQGASTVFVLAKDKPRKMSRKMAMAAQVAGGEQGVAVTIK